MADLATLKVRVDATEAVNATKRLGTELKTVDREAKSVTSTMRGLRGAFSAVAGSMVVREFVRMADTARLLEGRLKLVTNSADDLAGVQDALFQSAQRTRTSFAGSVELYARVARATQDLGIAQADMLRFTELTNMAIKASGASSTEASAALIQLSQGLASGVLRGEEFNSVMEQTPAVAQALAQSLGVGIGQLRAMSQAGELTAQTIIDGILKAEKTIREDFATAPKTVADAWETSKNSILKALGELDNATNSSAFFRSLVAAPGQLAQGLDEMFGKDRRRAAQRADDQAFAYRNADPAFRAEQAAERARQAEAERAQQQAASIAVMRDYADELVKLSELLPLNAGQLQILRNADASYANALRDGSLAIADRIKLLERQRGVQDVLSAAQQRAATAQSAAALERLRPTLGAATTTTVGGKTPATLAAGGQARIAEKMQRDALMKASQQAGVASQREYEERIKIQGELAKNFRENMQRAFGDVLTEFVTRGKVSIADVFGSLKQMGGSMIGQGVSKMITGALPAAMGPLGFLAAGAGLLGLGSLFGRRRNRAPRESESERIAREQARFAANEDAKRARDREMAEFMAGRTAGRGGVIQSVGQVLQETSASRMIGELVAIRIATTRTADAVAGGQFAGGPATINVTVQGGLAGNMQAVGEQVAEAVDRLLGTRVQTLRLSSGQAVTA